MNIIELKSTVSTNRYVAEMKIHPDLPFIVKSEFQSGGKGQGEKSWESERNKNLLISLVFQPFSVAVEKSFFISKFIAVCLTKLLSEFSIETQIKWPNDILFKRKKIAGILIENTFQGLNIQKSIVGIGLNVNQENFSSENKNAISMQNISKNPYEISDILQSIIDVFNENMYLLKEKRFTEINELYFASLFQFEKMHRFTDSNQEFLAKIVDVNDYGNLVLETINGRKTLYGFGEIEFDLSKA